MLQAMQLAPGRPGLELQPRLQMLLCERTRAWPFAQSASRPGLACVQNIMAKQESSLNTSACRSTRRSCCWRRWTGRPHARRLHQQDMQQLTQQAEGENNAAGKVCLTETLCLQEPEE